MIIHSIRYIALVLLASIITGLASCSSDTPDPSNEEGEGAIKAEQLTLCLNVSFAGQTSYTRASTPTGYEEPSGEFEKISGMRVIIIRELNEDKTSGTVEANRMVVTNDQGRPLYDNLEFEVIADEFKRIYIIANEAFLTPPSSFSATDVKATKFLDSLKVGKTVDLTALQAWTVSLPDLTASTETVKKGLFSPADSRRLPLTEFFDIFVERDQPTSDTCYSHLFLTRAAAKAVFFLTASDNFLSSTEVENTRITAISLTGIGTTEYVFPYETEYSTPKNNLISSKPDFGEIIRTYITNFETPTTNRTLKYLIDDIDIEIKKTVTEGEVVNTEYVGNAKQLNASPIYFPESILEPGEKYIVGVQLNNKIWLEAPLETNAQTKSEANILTIGEGENARDAIARNTYLPILINFNGAADISVRVLPWNREDYYVDYTANVGINGDECLTILGTSGQTGDYLDLDRTTAQLVLNYGKVAEAQFRIASPINTQWDAYLITTGGAQDAIQFQIQTQIPDPEDETKFITTTTTTTHISGKVGEWANFGIVSTVPPGPVQNSAQLVVFVTLVNGTQVIANVINKTWGTNLDRLTIIENSI